MEISYYVLLILERSATIRHVASRQPPAYETLVRIRWLHARRLNRTNEGTTRFTAAKIQDIQSVRRVANMQVN